MGYKQGGKGYRPGNIFVWVNKLRMWSGVKVLSVQAGISFPEMFHISTYSCTVTPLVALLGGYNLYQLTSCDLFIKLVTMSISCGGNQPMVEIPLQ